MRSLILSLFAIGACVVPAAARASGPIDLGSPPPTCEAAHLDFTDSSCTVDTRYGRFRIAPSVVHAGQQLTGTAAPGEAGCGADSSPPCAISWDGFLGAFPGAKLSGCAPTMPGTCTITVPKATPTTRYTTAQVVINGGISRSYYAVLGEGDYQLSGHVADPGGKPIAKLRLEIRGPGVHLYRTTDATGGYSAILHRGRYTVAAKAKPVRSAGCRPEGGKCAVDLTRDRVADFVQPTACDNPKPFSLPDVPTKTQVIGGHVEYTRTVRVSTQDCLLMQAQWTPGDTFARADFVSQAQATLSVDGRAVAFTWLELNDTDGLADLVWPQFPFEAGRHKVDLHVDYEGNYVTYRGTYDLHVVIDAQGAAPPASSGKPPCPAVAVSQSGAHIEGPAGEADCEPWGQRVTDTIEPASALDDTPDCESATTGTCLAPGAEAGEFWRDVPRSAGTSNRHDVPIVLPHGSDRWHALRHQEKLHIGDVLWGTGYEFRLDGDRGHTWTILGGPIALVGPTEFQPMQPAGSYGTHTRIVGPRGGEIAWRRDVGTFSGQGTFLLVIRRPNETPRVTSLLPADIDIDRSGPR